MRKSSKCCTALHTIAWLIQRDPGDQGKGSIERYDVQRGKLQEYWIDNGGEWASELAQM